MGAEDSLPTAIVPTASLLRRNSLLDFQDALPVDSAKHRLGSIRDPAPRGCPMRWSFSYSRRAYKNRARRNSSLLDLATSADHRIRTHDFRLPAAARARRTVVRQSMAHRGTRPWQGGTGRCSGEPRSGALMADEVGDADRVATSGYCLPSRFFFDRRRHPRPRLSW